MDDPTQDNPPAEDWRASLKDESLRSSKSLEKFKELDALGKSYVELEGKLGRSVELPKDETDTEAWNRLYDRLGRPKTAEDYELKSIEDEGLKKSLVERALKHRVGKKELLDIADAFAEREKARSASKQAEREKAYKEGEERLKAKYGDKYAEVPEKASKAFTKMFAGKEGLYERLKAAGFDNDPDMVETFAEFYSVLSPEDQMIVGDKGGAPKKEADPLAWMYEKYGGSPTPGRT